MTGRQRARRIDHPRLSVVMPAYNEIDTIEEIIRRVLAVPLDIELVVASGLLAAVFLGGFPGGALLGFAHFVVKTLFVIFLLSLIRALTARIRIDQVVSFAWKVLAPLAVLQLLVTILLKGFLS